MKKKLLNKTLRVYILFSLIVLLISAPLFYFLADKLFIDDADEALLLRKREFSSYNLPTLRVNDIPIWNKFNRDIKIEENRSKMTHDSMLYRFYLDTLANNENEPYRVLLSPITIEQKPYVLMARINLVESEDMIKSIALLFCMILSALLIGLYFITRRLSSILWSPFYLTLEKVEQFELEKNTKPEFEENDVEEFSRLDQSIARMMERNVVVYKSQKEFIENAAHELQTPLAIFQAKLDSLAQQLPFTDSLSSTLSDLNDAAGRLNRINRNLLLLSKMENNQYEEVEPVEISALLKRLVSFLEDQAEKREVKVHMKHLELLTINANTTLTEIAISNLLLNALRYNRANGEIMITLHDKRLTITNTGENRSLDVEKLFKRFSQGSGGNGLGLAIVRKVCELHHWAIIYSFQNGMHSFQVCF